MEGIYVHVGSTFKRSTWHIGMKCGPVNDFKVQELDLNVNDGDKSTKDTDPISLYHNYECSYLLNTI